MIQLLAYWKQILGAALAGALFLTGWHYGSAHVQANWDKQTAAAQAESMRVMQVHADMINTLEVQHDKNTTRIDQLAADNRSLRLRLQPTSCPSQDANPVSGVQAASGSRLLHLDPSEIIAGYTDEVGRQFVIADKVVEDCRVMQRYLQSLGKKQ